MAKQELDVSKLEDRDLLQRWMDAVRYARDMGHTKCNDHLRKLSDEMIRRGHLKPEQHIQTKAANVKA